MSLYQRLRNNIPSRSELNAFGNGFWQGFTKEKSRRSIKKMLSAWWVEVLDKIGPATVAGFVVFCILSQSVGAATQLAFGTLNFGLRSISDYVVAGSCIIAAIHFSGGLSLPLAAVSTFGFFLNERMKDLKITSTLVSKIYQGLIDGKAELERFRANMQKERDIMAPVVTTLFGIAQQQSPLSRLPQPVIKDIVMPLLAASSRYSMQKERDIMAPVVTTLFGTAQPQSPLSRLPQPVIKDIVMPLLAASSRYSNENLAENFFASKYAKRAAQPQAAANRGM